MSAKPKAEKDHQTKRKEKKREKNKNKTRGYATISPNHKHRNARKATQRKITRKNKTNINHKNHAYYSPEQPRPSSKPRKPNQ
jgi:hypothetical protein